VGAGHHFLPKFFLKGFTDPDPPKGHTPFLWIYNFEERRWRKRSPANAAKKTEKSGVFPDGLALEGAEISLPLSRTHCFVGSWKWKGVTWRLATRDLVAEVNKRSAYFAKMFIAGPKPGFPGAGEILSPGGSRD